ncbi:MAG: hypothetical protein EXS14_09775 [Planctomycetes bacterium]|nr:hypothetical protein [Planctomycetota bacterium]
MVFPFDPPTNKRAQFKESPMITCKSLSMLMLFGSLALAQWPAGPTTGAEPRHEVQATFKRQGIQVRVIKEIDPFTGVVTTRAHDRNGVPVDYPALLKAERDLGSVPANKLHYVLAQRLSEGTSGNFDIVVWCNFEPATLEHRDAFLADLAAGIPLATAQAQMRKKVADANRVISAPTEDLLRSMGLSVRYAAVYAPVLFTTVNAAQIFELANNPLVDTLYLENKEGGHDLDNAVATHRWNRVHDFGIRGDGMQVAVVEDDGVSNTHPAINHAGFFNAGSPNLGEHATTVAGIIGSTDGTYPGHARGVQILSGNAQTYSDANLTAATDWSITQGADVVNMSFGVSTTLAMVYMDRYVDYQIRATATTFVKSAGNQAAGCGVGSGPVTSPGLAWNIIATGNVSDQGNADWDDDVMYSTSSWDDPTSVNGDRQKPELSAVGTSIIGPNLAGGFVNQGSGTSYSAPAIAGMCAALMQANTILTGWPEAMKAIMMAASWENIEGSSRLSECDGAGSINGLAAYRMVEENTFRSGSFLPASFSNAGYYTTNIWLQAGDKCRVVLSWGSQANAAYTTDVLDADLDLAIFLGAGVTAGATLATSVSFDNSYEIVEFCPSVTGWHTVRVNDYRFDGASEYYGIAWSQHAQGRYARFRPWLPDVTANDLAGPSLGNISFWIDPIDSVNPAHSFLLFASLGMSTGFNFPAACRHSYGDLDELTYLSLDSGNPYFLNFSGVFGASGTTFSSRISIPDIPGIQGLELYLSEFTLDSAAPESIKEFGVLEKVTLWNHATTISPCDDCTVNVPLPFTFTFYGVPYGDCWINANGNISFTAGHISFSETVAQLLAGVPKICALWDDLNSNINGVIRYRASPKQLVVEWVDVSEFGTTATNNNSVICILNSDGSIELKFSDTDLLDAIVGVSPGGGALGLEVDLSHGFKTGIGGRALYEHFLGTGGAENLDLGIASSYRHTVRFTPTSSSNYRMTVDGANF